MTERWLIDFEKIDPEILARPLLFDTNVWLLVQGPQLDFTQRRSALYSKLYDAAIKAGTTIYLPSLVASEFVHVCISLNARAAGWEKGNGKVHAQPDYKDWIRDAVDDLNAIASDCTKIGDGFDQADIAPLCDVALHAKLEFNDAVLADMCLRNGLTLVTDDADLFDQPIGIISANRRLTP